MLTYGEEEKSRLERKKNARFQIARPALKSIIEWARTELGKARGPAKRPFGGHFSWPKPGLWLLRTSPETPVRFVSAPKR